MLADKRYLWLDASTSATVVGLVTTDGLVGAVPCVEAPLEGLLPAVGRLLDDCGVPLANLGGCIACEGPGSTLGLRLTAMACRTWQVLYPQTFRCFAYRSLDLAWLALESSGVASPFRVATATRKGRWAVIDAFAGELRVVAGELPVDVPCFVLPQRSVFAETPQTPGIREASFAAPELAALLGSAGLLRAVEAMPVLTPEAATYQTWK